MMVWPSAVHGDAPAIGSASVWRSGGFMPPRGEVNSPLQFKLRHYQAIPLLFKEGPGVVEPDAAAETQHPLPAPPERPGMFDRDAAVVTHHPPAPPPLRRGVSFVAGRGPRGGRRRGACLHSPASPDWRAQKAETGWADRERT